MPRPESQICYLPDMADLLQSNHADMETAVDLWISCVDTALSWVRK